jgi:hypothetical protein
MARGSRLVEEGMCSERVLVRTLLGLPVCSGGTRVCVLTEYIWAGSEGRTHAFVRLVLAWPRKKRPAKELSPLSVWSGPQLTPGVLPARTCKPCKTPLSVPCVGPWRVYVD